MDALSALPPCTKHMCVARQAWLAAATVLSAVDYCGSAVSGPAVMCLQLHAGQTPSLTWLTWQQQQCYAQTFSLLSCMYVSNIHRPNGKPDLPLLMPPCGCYFQHAGQTPSLTWLTWEQQQRLVHAWHVCYLNSSCRGVLKTTQVQRQA